MARSDRIVIGTVDKMQSALEAQLVKVRNGQLIMGTFVFTYVDVLPSEHLVGEPIGKVMVRLLGGIHPDGKKFTTYVDAPSVSSTEQVLLFLAEVPEPGPGQEVVYQIAYHRAGKFRVEGEGASALVIPSLPNRTLRIDPREGIGDEPILLEST